MYNIFLSSPLNIKDLILNQDIAGETVIHIVDVEINSISDIDHFMYLCKPNQIRFLFGGKIDFALFLAICCTGNPIDFLDNSYSNINIASVLKKRHKVKVNEIGTICLYTFIISYMEKMINFVSSSLESLTKVDVLNDDEEYNKSLYHTVYNCINRLFNDIRRNKKSFITGYELRCLSSLRRCLLPASHIPLFYIEKTPELTK